MSKKDGQRGDARQARAAEKEAARQQREAEQARKDELARKKAEDDAEFERRRQERMRKG